jgi:hypothetical protein
MRLNHIAIAMTKLCVRRLIIQTGIQICIDGFIKKMIRLHKA